MAESKPVPAPAAAIASDAPVPPAPPRQPPGEIGGPRGPEPTRFGDWETKGRCSDF
ncbi:MAG: succinate dehydrogenase assembly factor 4 [Rhodospirillaceae bacterium]